MEPAIKKGSILSLDLGTHLGWAVRMPSGDIASGVAELQTLRYEGGGMRWIRLYDHLLELHTAFDIALLSLEEVRAHDGVTAAHIYGGFLAMVTYFCEQIKVPYTSYGVGTIKKHATGSGSASKDTMVKAANKRGHRITNDNEADALGLLYLTIEEWGHIV